MYSYDYLFSRINLPKESISAISEAMKILSCDKKRMTDVFFSGGDAKAELTSVSSLHCEINEDLFWLAYIIILTERTYEIYREKNLSEDLFYDTMEDITIWVKRTKRDFGTWGIHGEFGWLSNHLRTALFRFGRIQFELSKHNRETYSKNGRTISRGETIINMHIPDDGHPLLRSLRQDSYNRAAEFFGLDVFVCN